MYYLQSRYYDPAIGRFINADTFATTDANGLLSCNMFAYCENDPINRSDPDGREAVMALIAVTSGIIGFAVGMVTQIAANKLYGRPTMEGAWGAGVGGATYNVVSVFAGPVAAGYASAFAESFTNEALTYGKNKKALTKENFKQSAAKVVFQTAVNGTGYVMSGEIANRVFPMNYSRFKGGNVSFTFKDLKQVALGTLFQSGAFHIGRLSFLASLS